MMEHISIAVLIALSAFLLVWAISDIIKQKRNRLIILLLLLAPIIGPIIYFQASRRPGRRNTGMTD